METIIITLLGFLAISVFDASGAILSRILKFNYASLIFGSVIIYGFIAFNVAKFDGIIIGTIASGIVGLFDATAGSMISKKLKPHIPKKELIDMNITPKMVITVGFFASVVGLVTISLFG